MKTSEDLISLRRDL